MYFYTINWVNLDTEAPCSSKLLLSQQHQPKRRKTGEPMVAKGDRASFWDGKNVPKLIIMLATQLCEYAKNQWLVYLKWVNCMACKLYLNKAIIFEKREPVCRMCSSKPLNDDRIHAEQLSDCLGSSTERLTYYFSYWHCTSHQNSTLPLAWPAVSPSETEN